jgi:hypothetical protein
MNPAQSTHTVGMHTHPVLVRENWQIELDEAIRRNDDAGMWEVVARQPDQEEAQEAMATLVSRLAYRIDSRPRFSEMFLLPMIEPAGANVIANEAAWKAASFAVGEALDSWLPKKTAKTVFNGIRPFDWVGTWRPAVLRSHLYRTMPGNDQASITTLSEDIACPDEAPRLGFLCMVLTSDRGWPTLPRANTLADKRLRDVVGFAFHDNAYSTPPTALTPDRVQFAMVDGVCLWLHELDRTCKVLGWSATPIAASADVVKVTLRLDSEQVPLTQFTLRKHQIGLRGVDEVLQMLASLAPVMDAARDAPAKNMRS